MEQVDTQTGASAIWMFSKHWKLHDTQYTKGNTSEKIWHTMLYTKEFKSYRLQTTIWLQSYRLQWKKQNLKHLVLFTLLVHWLKWWKSTFVYNHLRPRKRKNLLFWPIT